MRSARPRQSSSGFGIFGISAVVLATLVVGASATVGGLWYAGVPIPYLSQTEAVRPGVIWVPAAPTMIPAYTKITRDIMFTPGTVQLEMMAIDKAVADRSECYTTFDQIRGRVLKNDKLPKLAFTEADFLPKGTREGIVAAIPPGKRAVTIEASKIQGIYGLRVGDHIDLMSTQSVDMSKVFGDSGGKNNPFVGLMKQTKQAQVRVLVQNGLIVSPIRTREVPVSSTSLINGNKNGKKPIEEVVVAVDPEEIAPLTEAVSVEAMVTCVARSGLPDDPGVASVTPNGASPLEQVSPVERISGGKREVMFVPRTTLAPTDPRSMVAIPLCGESLPAGATITPEHLIDHATNRPRIVSLRVGDVRRLGLVTDAARIVGRTLKVKKNADTGFTEGDFVPVDPPTNPTTLTQAELIPPPPAAPRARPR